MKASLYLNYTSRSLLRSGQRTILAVFCIAVGVMSIVALQLVGFMLQTSLTSNVRDINGGDLSVTAQTTPLHTSDLTFFDRLKSDSTISDYTAISMANGGLKATTPSVEDFTVEAVNPSHYPLTTPPNFATPGNGTVSGLLTNDQVIATQSFLDRYGKKVGNTFDVYTKTSDGAGRTLHVKLAGVIANAGSFSQAGNLLLISAQDYASTRSNSNVTYSVVDMTTMNVAHANTAAKAINKQFPLASTQTVADVLKTQQSSLDSITQFLEIAGLLALLIGGIGIINTMQVLLSRRKTEIAMLKTAGYRRLDLYTLFGLEAGLLGMIGGVIGAAAATGVSAIVRQLMINLGSNMLFVLNPWIIAGGILIGFGSALIFGLLPIVQAASIRPLNVIREITEHRSVGSTAMTLALLALFSILFCALAIVIMNNNVLLSVEVVYGAFAFLLVLGLLFSLVVLILSKLPVPERFSFGFIALVLAGIVASVMLYLFLPVFGVILLIVVLIGVAFALAPLSWKVSMRLALRNIGRRRTRTTTTIVALFVGIFTIGLVVALGQDLQAKIGKAFSQGQYNVLTVTSGTDSSALHSQLNTIPGLSQSQQDIFSPVIPLAINATPLQQVLPTGSHRQEALNFMSSMEGYDLASNQPSLKLTQGRNLNASDANSSNVVIIDQLASTGSVGMSLKPGDTITFMSADGKARKVVTIVGIYTGAVSVSHLGMVLAPTNVVNTLSATKTGTSMITYMKIDPAQINHALDTIGRITPNATVQNVADVIGSFTQQLASFLDILVAIASLSMIAGVVIIANSVALAMLERRRELGILKSVGYTSGTILREVLIENGIVGAIGAVVAMLLAAGGVALLGSLLFNLTLSISPWIVVTLVSGSILLAMLTAALVAWGSVRTRPLAVLRYE
ncbi:MAG TPA: FtsX-like permease family protein [Ktedonobacteraceae bacterium]|jgi:predicted lysophospholipase L1 biosynthesis ABC-type transport system permease subunit|nr:FtsX-like permease family protein [Ktedonobacteraceae bacterium]